MFDSKYTNKSVYANGSAVNVRKLPSTASDVLLKKDGYIGRTSGAFLKMTDGIWFQINFENKIDPLVTQGYVRSDVVNFKEPSNNASTVNAQAMLNQLIACDKNIYTILVKLAPTVKILRQTGSIDSNTLNLYKSLLQRLYERQQAFVKTQLVQYKTGQLKGYDQEKKDLAEVWSAIGIAPLVVGIIIGVIVLASAATACYYAFKPNYEDSKADFILSKQLDETLKKKLTTEEYTQLKKEGEKNVDDAYNAGKGEGKVSLVMKIGAFLAAFWAVDKFILTPRKGK